MKSNEYNLPISFSDILNLVRQLSTKDQRKMLEELRKMSENSYPIMKERMTHVMRIIKPYIKGKLGKNTHKKTTEQWTFYGLAFTHPEMVYVFGFNIGFFKAQEGDFYTHAGVNVLVRTNGELPEYRQRFVDFFREHLKYWINKPEGAYSSERGGEGVEFARYRALESFKTDDEIVDFLKETIDGLNNIYPVIVENKDDLFDKVVRAAPQWKEQIVDVCKNYLSESI